MRRARWEDPDEQLKADYIAVVEGLGFTREDVMRVWQATGMYPTALELALASAWRSIRLLVG